MKTKKVQFILNKKHLFLFSLLSFSIKQAASLNNQQELKKKLHHLTAQMLYKKAGGLHSTVNKLAKGNV